MTTQGGWTVWLTGLPGSGKTTLARTLQRRLRALGAAPMLLDSDELRLILAPAVGYDEAGRDRFYGALVDLVVLLQRDGASILVAATAPRRRYREAARARLKPFAEIWVRCPLAVCRSRDPKGLYAQAAAGQLQTLPGLNAEYEAPLNAEIVVDTDQFDLETAADQVLAKLAGLRWSF